MGRGRRGYNRDKNFFQVNYLKHSPVGSAGRPNSKIGITHVLICYVKSSTLSNERKNKGELPYGAL